MFKLLPVTVVSKFPIFSSFFDCSNYLQAHRTPPVQRQSPNLQRKLVPVQQQQQIPPTPTPQLHFPQGPMLSSGQSSQQQTNRTQVSHHPNTMKEAQPK